ncbi:unnamed protein product [Phyllotreta striolata]|uniref:Peptidase S54 rhomboid domain-containing protein n=1 Tax=Phyllotreta striolata TaxID=444603 RepID=A0A9N9TUA9_PHYSR|nr:unnamed protein product [Phyllotreta striolata]
MADTSPRNDQTASPAVTPESSIDEENFLVPRRTGLKEADGRRRRPRWRKDTPFGILAVSLIQLLVHALSTPRLSKRLRFEPDGRLQIWRFITYMFVHDDWYHVTLNVLIQTIFAVLPEKRQGRWRVLLLYFLGGFLGVLAASCVRPDIVIGASAGVYALLISHLSDIILNYSTVEYKVYRAGSIGVLVVFDVAYNVVHVYLKKEPVISWEAHFAGGAAGLLLGFVLYRSDDKEKSAVNRTLYWASFFIYIALVTCCVVLTVQIERCTDPNVIRFRYIYVC